MDENPQTEALNPEPGDETQLTESPSVEEQTTQEPEITTTEPSSEAEEVQEAPRKQPESQRRIRELANDRRRLQEQLEAYQTQSLYTPPSGDAWEQYQSGEITLDQLKNLTTQTAMQAAALETQKLRQEISFSSDLRTVESKYPKLNPESSEYDQDYDDKISKLYQRAGGINSGVSLPEFIQDIESLGERVASQKTKQITQTLAKQAAEGGMAPTSSDTSSKKVDLGALLDRASRTGSTEAWTEYLKAKRQS